MTDEQFTQTPGWTRLCAEFNVQPHGDAAANLGLDDQRRFWARYDELKAEVEQA